jgi:hypothetical protein
MTPHVDLSSVVRRLRANADAVAAQVAGVGDDEARWKPEPTKWSILEVVTHLADEEVEDFRRRVDLTLHSPRAEWPPIDPEGWAVQRRYSEGDLQGALGRFLTSRAESVDWLESLVDPDWDLAYRHPRFGPIRAGDLLTSWVAHDYIHIRQLNRLQRELLVTSISGYSPAYAGRW